jgi:hypothetical protein
MSRGRWDIQYVEKARSAKGSDALNIAYLAAIRRRLPAAYSHLKWTINEAERV